MSSRRAFTLIELLVVMGIIAILAAIVLPRFARSKERAVTAMLQADLRYLATVQEAHFTDASSYASNPATLDFTASEGVTISIAEATNAGWSATATHPGTSSSCALFVGSAAPVSPASDPGVVTCN